MAAESVSAAGTFIRNQWMPWSVTADRAEALLVAGRSCNHSATCIQSITYLHMHSFLLLVMKI